jgi:hypothetical protein
MTLVSLQFNGDGDLLVDADGNPIYERAPTGDLYMATAQLLGSYHADPDLGSTVPGLVSGEARTRAEIKDAIADGLRRLETVGVLVVDDILVLETTALVLTSATDQPFQVNL